jgi:hypothetical protein
MLARGIRKDVPAERLDDIRTTGPERRWESIDSHFAASDSISINLMVQNGVTQLRTECNVSHCHPCHPLILFPLLPCQPSLMC